MGDISKNFSRSEFLCGCNKCGFDTVDIELIQLCETVRELNGNVALKVGCGCRCRDHNKREGGADKSQHLIGKAADLYVNNPTLVYYTLCDMYPDKYGFGLYSWGVHVDSRSKKGRWT